MTSPYLLYEDVYFNSFLLQIANVYVGIDSPIHLSTYLGACSPHPTVLTVQIPRPQAHLELAHSQHRRGAHPGPPPGRAQGLVL